MRTAPTSRASAILVTALGVGALLLAGCARPAVVAGAPAPSDRTTGRTTPPSTAPSPNTAPPPNTQPPPSTRPPSPARSGQPCRGSQLTVVDIRSGGAMGSIGYDVVVRNTGSTACRLSGVPDLHYHRADGGAGVVPHAPAPDGPPVLVAPSATALLLMHHTNGYGGYATDSPECAHPATYRGIWIVIGGNRLDLSGLTLEVLCGELSVLGWEQGG